MSTYDRHAADYDATRGGVPRASAAADVVGRLLVPGSTVLDLATGTGIVAVELRRRGFHTVGIDVSDGMLRNAAGRLPGSVARAAAEAMPLRDGSIDAVVAIWLLHLLDAAAPTVREVTRVLAPGGLFVTTADKRAASRLSWGAVADDGTDADRAALLVRDCAAVGLDLVGAASFVGVGQAAPGRPDPVYPVLAFRRN
ncbi:class I SAM-dependent methyltransferase [Tsukamurella paurometabola]|uniref:Predicted methyltransferase (Contains TPR repeat) n=1 Tax=Tsukamurella paurometabola TaxID=2061 RepID=A0A3P8LFY0_TSUPA|nr:class I SAM-dependent methyltransferase [Tsukamurella paurometabola]UEA82960.1 class I SAM-dependent methyltransferase [Tsukamurella paurometabola]VDR40042.1 Predicted methyltransferase (contains TPR repeat) [Tsukamurella paurometabola]